MEAPDPWQQVETIVQSTLGEDDLFDREICVKILEDVGGLSDARAVLEAFGQEPKIRIRDLLRFIRAPACGLYSIGYWYRYLIITAKGNTYFLECSNSCGNGRLTANPHRKFSGKRWRAMDKPVNIDGWMMKLETIANLIGPEEVAIAMKPRDFSPCLVGSYGPKVLPGAVVEIGTHTGPGVHRTTVWTTYSEECTVQKNGSIQYRPSYRKCSSIDRPEESWTEGFEDMRWSQVKCVRRSDQWPLVLHPGPGAHIEVQYPPLCFIELEDGTTIDLARAGFTSGSALLSSAKISYPGNIKDAEGGECIVSFPGRYPEGWLECVEGSHDMSVACVFLCDKGDGLGSEITRLRMIVRSATARTFTACVHPDPCLNQPKPCLEKNKIAETLRVLDTKTKTKLLKRTKKSVTGTAAVPTGAVPGSKSGVTMWKLLWAESRNSSCTSSLEKLIRAVLNGKTCRWLSSGMA